VFLIRIRCVDLPLNAFAKYLPRPAQQRFDSVRRHLKLHGHHVSPRTFAIMQVQRASRTALELLDALAQRIEIVIQTSVRASSSRPNGFGRFQLDRAYLAMLFATKRQQLIAGDNPQVSCRLPLAPLDELASRERQESLLREIVSFAVVGAQKADVTPNTGLVQADYLLKVSRPGPD
jgi:hypothetical protein